MIIPDWVSNYIGIPYMEKGQSFEASDCLGLVELVYKNVLGITLPDYNHINCNNLKNVSLLMIEEEQSGRWEKVDKPQENCVILMNICAYPVHTGIVLNDEYMLHSLKGHNSAVERFTGAKWKNRIEGYYAWRSM